MQVILLEKVANLGNLGDVVKVKDGYARNFLIPTRQARRATEAAIKEFEAKRAELEKVAAEKLASYKEMAQFLGTKRYSNESVVEYFKRLYPISENAKKKEMTKAASEIFGIIDTQPGSGFAPGTWWNAYNAVSYYTDHLAGRSEDNRLQSAWYGHNAKVKKDALELALEMAGS